MGCWLNDGNQGDPLAMLLEIEGGDEFLRQLYVQRTAPFAPNNKENLRDGSKESQWAPGLSPDWPGRRLPLETSAALTIIWDALDRSCALKAKAVRHEFTGL